MSITKTAFGQTPCGCPVSLYTMTNASGASVSIADFGGTIVNIMMPDKDGKLANVICGFDSIEKYFPRSGYLGALIGRVGNRICNGEFELNGVKYTLAKNERGLNHLHGGTVGFDQKIWDVTPVEGICSDSLYLKLTSEDGEEGYPGKLQVMVTYTFTDDNELAIRYEAVSDKDTLCNLTNHTYFNLAGEGTILDHTIELNCDTFTVVDNHCIPTGESRDVTGTPFDLRTAKRIGDGIAMIDSDEQMKNGNGYDHNFNINDPEAGLRFAACVTDPKSGRMMEVFTDMPAVQFYAGNSLKSANVGHAGKQYAAREGLCLETQYAPDSINHPEFPDSVLYAGEKYDFTTVFSFGVAE
ncbi:MAG: galactose mutarotase [Clostridia bacterium]|nr:galactose mutarotase [Clostridia bacterium]